MRTAGLHHKCIVMAQSALVHRLEDYRGARIINPPGDILVHRCTWHAHITARFTWEQTAGGTVRTARSARDHAGTRAGSNGRRWPNGLRLLPGRPTAPGNRVARGGTQGGLNCLTHALPRRLPTPTEEADGNGYGVIAGRRGPSRPPPRASVNLVPLLLTGVSLHPPAPKGGPTRTSADVSVPRLAGFSLIT